ncbi:MAG: ribonuclease HII [Bacteroidales bacterium]|nr:ribonuclease HII [Bacteroidales bacterium]
MKKSKLKSYYKKGIIEAGCDEAGRGCLAGPVFAAAVILPEKYFHPLLNDSKKLNEKLRNTLRIEIEQTAICWAVAKINNIKIDEINILNASILAMQNAISQLKIVPECLLIDGNRFKLYKNIPHHCIIKGDGKYFSIAAASILAKTYRDDYMKKIHDEFPDYNWKQNKGYPTKQHRNVIKEKGITPYHRKSFKLIDNQLKIPEFL